MDFQFPDSSLLRELNCVCDESRGDDDDDNDSRGVILRESSGVFHLLSGSFGYDRFSDIFNPYILAFASSNG